MRKGRMLAHNTLEFRVYMYKVRYGTRQSCGCLEDEELALLPGIVSVMYGGLLNHMTIHATKLGVSYDDI